MSLLLGGCGSSLFADVAGKISEPLNQRVEAHCSIPKPVPEFPSAIEPEALLINTLTPQLDSAKFRLTVDGEVSNPISLSVAEIQQMPLTSMIIRHVCVEGWAAIVQWGGYGYRTLCT